LGPVGSGKTALWYQLKNEEFRDTHTSLTENIGTFIPKQLQDPKLKLSPLRYVDLPGHGSLRWKLQQYLDQTKGVVFVVDASSESSLATSSEQLFEILTSARAKTPILIACNKNDLDDGLSTDDVKKRLEQALDKIRNSQTTTLGDLQDKSHTKAGLKLGRDGLPFKFDHSACPVRFGTITVKLGSIRPVLDFIKTLK